MTRPHDLDHHTEVASCQERGGGGNFVQQLEQKATQRFTQPNRTEFFE